ncbi:ead/Ea22-like family protein [Klebsiella michiganensis]|uniref:ead/Ea22-like family protein n=1 Tax=Klebsiella michiganensis TaxID=1134687 RepID=UPI00386292D7
MTDITELAPAMKAAAEPISSGYSRNWIVSHDDETCWVGANDDDGNLTPFIEVSIADWSGNKADNETLARFIALCRPANVIALVEALEKVQQYAKERDAENQDLMLTVGRLRVEREELESRTVKLPERYAWQLGYIVPDPNGDLLDLDDVIAALAAAGIKVEAE